MCDDASDMSPCAVDPAGAELVDEGDFPDQGSAEARALASALIVEDNVIIAMDVHDILMELGAGAVHVASRVDEALRILETTVVTFVLLDASLGKETSQAVAWSCVERGIPVVLATGYGLDAEVMAGYPKMLVLDKPFGIDALRRVIAQSRR